MKKAQAILLLMLLLLTSGCSANATAGVSEEVGHKLGLENTYIISIDANTKVIPYAISAESAIDLSDYDNILTNSSDIICGEVESIENFNASGGTAWVKERVRILETYKGQLSPGAEITYVGFLPGDAFGNVKPVPYKPLECKSF